MKPAHHLDVSGRSVRVSDGGYHGSPVGRQSIRFHHQRAVHIEEWCNRPLQSGKYPYVYVNGIYHKRNWGGEDENVAVLVEISFNKDG